MNQVVEVEVVEKADRLVYRVNGGQEQVESGHPGETAGAIPPLLERLQATVWTITYRDGMQSSGRRTPGAWRS